MLTQMTTSPLIWQTPRSLPEPGKSVSAGPRFTTQFCSGCPGSHLQAFPNLAPAPGIRSALPSATVFQVPDLQISGNGEGNNEAQGSAATLLADWGNITEFPPSTLRSV
jgi:hypothetical protein